MKRPSDAHLAKLLRLAQFSAEMFESKSSQRDARAFAKAAEELEVGGADRFEAAVQALRSFAIAGGKLVSDGEIREAARAVLFAAEAK